MSRYWLPALCGALLAAFMGPQIFKSLACWRSVCDGVAGPEAEALGAFAAFVIAISISCIRSRPAAAGAAGAALVVGIVSALANKDFAGSSLFALVFFAGVLICILAIPYGLRPQSWSSERLTGAYARIFGAMSVAIPLGAVTQVAGEILWTGFSGWGADKFVVAPSGTVIAGAAWCALILETRDGEAFRSAPSRRLIWLAAAVVGALLISSVHGLLFIREHVVGGTPHVTAIVASAGLILPGIVTGYAVLSIRSGRVRPCRGAAALTLVASVVAATLAALAARELEAGGVRLDRDPRKWMAFSVSHGLTVAALVASVVYGGRVLPAIVRRWPDIFPR